MFALCNRTAKCCVIFKAYHPFRVPSRFGILFQINFNCLDFMAFQVQTENIFLLFRSLQSKDLFFHRTITNSVLNSPSFP